LEKHSLLLFLHAVFIAGGIAVNTDDFVVWKELLQNQFTALGALPQRLDVAAITTRATLGQSALVIAVVAVQVARCLMHRHARIAVIAVGKPAAIVTLPRAKRGACPRPMPWCCALAQQLA
jgi:hypothetical protein